MRALALNVNICDAPMFNFLTEFSKNWTGQQRLFAFVFLIALVE